MSQCNHKANLFSAIHNGILSKAVHIKYTTFRGSRRVLKYLYDGGHIQGYRLLDSGKFIIYLKVDNLNNEKAGV
jgi:ribosomal protein S8